MRDQLVDVQVVLCDQASCDERSSDEQRDKARRVLRVRIPRSVVLIKLKRLATRRLLRGADEETVAVAGAARLRIGRAACAEDELCELEDVENELDTLGDYLPALCRAANAELLLGKA